MATQLPPSKRTQGDGMEKVENENQTEHTVVLCPQETRKVSNSSDVSEKDPPNKNIIKNLGLAIKLTPHAVDRKKKDILSNLKNKEPKFVPYEPYKAAVRPIVPPSKKSFFRQVVRKKSKDFANVFSAPKNIEGVLHKLKDEEPKKADGDGDDGGDDDDDEGGDGDGKVEETNWEERAKVLESEMRTLREENEQLENQLKFQVQVNGELKNLLVAAIGEDMETKVHVLTEDKLHLAQALLRSAESLNTHQEQTEWLAGQCEVWRSKFLASSVMVEELARWKASLCQKVNEAHDALRKLLEDGKQVREYVFKTHANLCRLRDSFDLHSKKNNVSSSNVVNLSADNLKLSEVLLVQLLGSDNASRSKQDPPPYLEAPKKTAAEKLAEQVLANPNLLQVIGEPDAACNAVVGAAVTLSGQLYLQNHPPKIECCRQCKGEIKLI